MTGPGWGTPKVAGGRESGHCPITLPCMVSGSSRDGPRRAKTMALGGIQDTPMQCEKDAPVGLQRGQDQDNVLRSMTPQYPWRGHQRGLDRLAYKGQRTRGHVPKLPTNTKTFLIDPPRYPYHHRPSPLTTHPHTYTIMYASSSIDSHSCEQIVSSRHHSGFIVKAYRSHRPRTHKESPDVPS